MTRDINYNVGVLVGKFTGSDESILYKFAVDLNSPWSWIKTVNCKKC